MATPKNPLSIYDVVTAVDGSIQAAHANGFKIPPTGETTVIAVDGEQVLLSDGSIWHHSHFKKIGESLLKEEAMEAAAEMDDEAGFAENLDVLGQHGEFNEFVTLVEIAEYIAETYGEHYAKDGVQAFSLIAKRPARGRDFAIGNVLKYADRYGNKGGHNRKDLLKIVHYAILAIYAHDEMEESDE